MKNHEQKKIINGDVLPSYTSSTSNEAKIETVTINFGELPYIGRDILPILEFPKAELKKIEYHNDHFVEGFPLVWSPTRIVDSLEMNLYLEHRYKGKFLRPRYGGNRNLLGGVTVKTLKNVAYSLLGFLQWLAETNTDWREVYAIVEGDKAKAWLPPYRYRKHLIKRVESKEISRDSANLYINHIRQFYEWALQTGRVERLPFKYSRVPIKKKRKDNEFDFLFQTVSSESVFTVQTSDLVIPKKYKSKNFDALSPFDHMELKAFLDCRYMQLESRNLWAELALVCGLRADEVGSFPEDAVKDPSLNKKGIFEIQITGKFNKKRKILVPKFLMHALWDYKNSADRLHRAARWDLNNGVSGPRPLFINRSGKRINSRSISNLTSIVKKELATKGISFDRSFHDLRATFATNLAKFMLEKNLPMGFIQYKLMALLGHTNFSTTQKYINFARSVTFEDQMKGWVSEIFSDLLPTLKSESKE